MQKAALYTAAVIFELIGVVHLVRYFLAAEVTAGGRVIPASTSLPIGIAFLMLMLWMIVVGWWGCPAQQQSEDTRSEPNARNYSDLSSQEQTAWRDQLNRHLQTVQNFTVEIGKVAMQYLLVGNAGGAVAYFSYMGGLSNGTCSSFICIAPLYLFSIGLVMGAVCVFVLGQALEVAWIRREDHIRAFYSGEIDEQVLARSLRGPWILPFAWSFGVISLLVFILGIVWALMQITNDHSAGG